MKIQGKYRLLTLAAGIATACLIVFSQLFYFQAATYCQKKAETQQKEKDSPAKTGQETGHEAYISIPSNTITSVSHVQMSEGLSFVLEILRTDREEKTTMEVPLLTGRLLHTLFRFIIAPNAP